MKLMRIITIAIIAAGIGGGIYIAKPQSLRPHPKEVHLRNIRQLTFGGDNAEAYWSLDGQKIIFQSTRDQIKCDQIFTMYRKRPDELWIFHARRQTDYLCVHSSGFARLSAPCG